MRTSTVLNILALVATTLAAPAITGSATIHNQCSVPFFVVQTGRNATAPVPLAPEGYWKAGLARDPVTGGIAIAIGATVDGFYKAEPTVTFGYTNDADAVYYSLGSSYGLIPALQGQNLVVHGTEGLPVPEIVWADGAPINKTEVYEGNTDIILEMCAPTV